MPRFRSKSKLGRTDRSQRGRRPIDLKHLLALVGRWSGIYEEVDEVRDQLHRIALTLDVSFRKDDGLVRIDYSSPEQAALPLEFEVMNVDPTSGEVVRTVFSGGRHQSASHHIAEVKTSRRGSYYKLKLVRAGWDHARPCEIRSTYELSKRKLRITKELSRPEHDGEFQLKSAYVLNRA